MKVHKFLTPLEIAGDAAMIRDPGVVRQMRSILHLAPGEECVVGDGHGTDVRIMIGEYTDEGVRGVVLSKTANHNDPSFAVTLACAILKGDHFDLVVQKATELGVQRIVPLVTARTIKKDINIPRLTAIIREAAEQADRGFLPALSAPQTFSAFLRLPALPPIVLLAKDGQHESVLPGAAAVGLCVGPEGGWADEEIALALRSGAHLRALGNLTLRGETAAIVGSAFACTGLL